MGEDEPKRYLLIGGCLTEENCNLGLAEKLGKKHVFGSKWAGIGRDDTKTGVLILKSREDRFGQGLSAGNGPKRGNPKIQQATFRRIFAEFLLIF